MSATATSDKHLFGFWVYLMTDLIMFAALFAAFAVLRGATFGGPALGSLFSSPNALAETLILLTSSFTCGLATLAVHAAADGGASAPGKARQAMVWFGVTIALGVAFLALEFVEFHGLIATGNGPQASAALSAFFTLVATHGLHIAVGLLWMIVAMVQMKVRAGARGAGSADGATLSPRLISKLDRLALFWHFLDLVWIFIFTIVYLMGIAV